MVTLSDVARASGVSLSTASRAINGSRNRVVNEALREQVLRAAADLNYSPNAAAQAMARGRTTTIGLIVNDISDPYFSGIAAGVAKAAKEHGCVVTLGTTDNDLDQQIALIDVMRSQRAQALIIAGGLRENGEHLARIGSAIDFFREAAHSNIALIGQPRLQASSVGIANHRGAADLAAALAGKGFRRFAVLRGPADHPTARERYEGFISGIGAGEVTAVVESTFDRDGGYAAMAIALESRPEVVFAVNDLMAMGALAAARDAGIRVPEDVGLAGFDDIPTLRDITPGITTVRAELSAMGKIAVRLALAPSTDGVERVEMPITLMLRESTRR